MLIPSYWPISSVDKPLSLSYTFSTGVIAQLDRASVSGTEGWRFEPSLPHNDKERTMSIQTEVVFKELDKYLKENKERIHSDDDMMQLANEFMKEYNNRAPKNNTPSTADDYLIRASKPETTKGQAINYVKKALELEPENLDANCELISLLYSDDPNRKLEELDKIIKKADDEYTKAGTFEQYDGKFWQFYETRPYMRLREAHFRTLIECRMISPAITEGQEMMKLNKDDNLGIRYTLAPLYVFVEDEKKLLSLSKKSKNDPPFLLALSALYYKLRDYDKAKEYLLKMADTNKDTKKFLRALVNDDMETLCTFENDMGYRPWTIEELSATYFENSFLYESMGPYFYWAYNALSKK